MRVAPAPLRSRRSARAATLLALGALALAAGAGCGEEEDIGGPVDPYPAPNFVLQDLNPASPTYLQSRSPSDVRGAVVVLYFASYS